MYTTLDSSAFMQYGCVGHLFKRGGCLTGIFVLIQVTILEASGRIGGRVKDDDSLGRCIGLGAMFITGICNNPLTLLARQLGIQLHLINEENCDLINEQGQCPMKSVDVAVEKHFNRVLDKLQDWRSHQTSDSPLESELVVVVLESRVSTIGWHIDFR
jgi:hypothetical protein